MNKKLKHALGWIGSFFLDSLAVALIGEVLKLFANPLAPSIGGIIGLLAIIATSILTFYLLMTLIRKTLVSNQFFPTLPFIMMEIHLSL